MRDGIRGALLSIAILVLISMNPVVLGNFSIISDQNLVSSQGIVDSDGHRTYIKEVNITIDLFEERVIGEGRFILFNPGNESERLKLFFDPSYYADDCSISVDGIDMELIEMELERDHYGEFDGENSFFYFYETDPYPVCVLDVNVPANDSIVMDVDWRTEPYVVYYEESSMGKDEIPMGEEYYKTKTTDWGNSYLVFSNSSWPEPIETFDLTYISHSGKFNEAKVWLTSDRMQWIWWENMDWRPEQADHVTVDMILDDDGNDVVKVHLEDWSYDDTYIIIDGADDREDVTPVATVSNLFCFLMIWIPILIFGIVILLIVRRGKRK